jgi:hypothetical protein
VLREIADPEDVKKKQKENFKKNKYAPSMVTLVATHPSPRMSPTTLRRKTIIQMKKIISTLSRRVPPFPD